MHLQIEIQTHKQVKIQIQSQEGKQRHIQVRTQSHKIYDCEYWYL